MVSDPTITGSVGWLGLFLTVAGFIVAIDQIRRTKKAAEAATTATQALTRAVFARERLIVVNSAIAHINNARERITQGRYEAALVFIDFSLTECVQIHELLGTPERKKFYKSILGLRKLGEGLSAAERDGNENETSFAFAIEAREIVGTMDELAAKLRYSYDKEGPER